MKQKKECYVVRNADADYEYIYAVVAESSNEAKKIGMGCLDCDYIDVRVKKHKKVDVAHLPCGEIQDYLWALKNGLYGWIEETCPKCKSEDGRVEWDNGFFCSNCEDNE